MGILDDVTGLSFGSPAPVKVQCDYVCSKKCAGSYITEYRKAVKMMATYDGKISCMPCHIKRRFSGRGNPNCKYKVPDDFFKNIDSEEKAYLFGWIASDGSIHENGSIAIAIHKKDNLILTKLKDIICPDLPIKYKKNTQLVLLSFCSSEIVSDLCALLDISPGKKSHTVGFPKLPNDILTWAFIRGYFDGDGTVRQPSCDRKEPECSITSNSRRMLEGIGNFSQIKYFISGIALGFSGTNALDFLSKLYDGAKIYLPRKYDRYIDWACWVPALKGRAGARIKLSNCLVAKSHPGAVIPSKLRASDVGYDMTIIKEQERFGENIILFDTGIKVYPEHGWYAQVVPRSSLSKTGYILSNSIGIIDRSYTGSIKIALTKIDLTKPDLVLPIRVAQLIFAPVVHFEIEEVDEFEITATERNAQGFGSSGTGEINSKKRKREEIDSDSE